MLLSGAFSQWSNTAFIHSSGRNLLDGAGRKIELNGVNLGGWLLWEGWIWGGGFKSETQIDQKVAALYGKDSVAAFKRNIHWNYISEADIRQIGSLGLNVVRIPFNHTLLESDEQPMVYKPEGFRLLDSVLKWCEKHKVYAVLDLHGAPGGQNSFFISDPDKANLWRSEQARKRTVALWHAVSKRYANRGIIAGYDLLNEPKVSDNGALVKLYQRIIDTIRTVDRNHLLFVEGNNLAQKFEPFVLDTGKGKLPVLNDQNLAYSFHYYTWFNEKNKLRTLQPHIDFCTNMNVPMWCGEWGEDSEANLEEVRHLLRDPDNGFCGTAFWPWKKILKDAKKPPVSGITFPADAKVVINWISGMGAKPTPEQAKAGWKEIFSAVRSENCALDLRMVKFLSAVAR